MKSGLKRSILQFKTNKAIKFERIYIFEPFRESLEDVHVKTKLEYIPSHAIEYLNFKIDRTSKKST